MNSEGVGPAVHEDLDVLLDAWLSEPDRQRAEQRFTRYFRAAFPQLCRFVRSFRADPATAQDISQQALIRFFVYVGTERRSADTRLGEALSGLQPLDFGALHVRLVQSWRGKVHEFRDAAVRFRIPAVQEGSQGWRELRDEINAQGEPLERQGWHFLEDVRARIESRFLPLISHASAATRAEEPSAPDTRAQSLGRIGEMTAHTVEAQTAAFVTALLEYTAGRDSREVGDTLGCAGAVEFVARTNTVCESLPVLAIPSNGLLYTIAKRQFLDSARRRRPQQLEFAAATVDETAESVLDELDLEAGSPAVDSFELQVEATTPDDHEPEDRVESAYRRFLEFLRLPLTRAEGALAEAISSGRARTEQARVDSLRRKYERLLAVLTALHESPQPSEEEIAHRQGLTRNQVKYVIKRIREEFNHFFPELAAEAEGRRKRQGA
jgi:DNA-directed RNA polymerase specialized sigma24 family protein